MRGLLNFFENHKIFVFSSGLLRCFLEMPSCRYGRTARETEKSIVQQRNFVISSAMDNCKNECFTYDSSLYIIHLLTLSVIFVTLFVLGILVGSVIDGYSFHHIYGTVYQVLCSAYSFH